MEKIKFNYSKLAGKIKEKFNTQKAFADELGITEGTLSSRMKGKTYFTQEEIDRSCTLLNLDRSRVTEYFFTE